MWKLKEPRTANTTEEEQGKKTCSMGIGSYFKNTIIKTMLYWYKDRQVNKWNEIESSLPHVCIYGQLIFNKVIIQWEKDGLFQQMTVRQFNLHIE